MTTTTTSTAAAPASIEDLRAQLRDARAAYRRASDEYDRLHDAGWFKGPMQPDAKRECHIFEDLLWTLYDRRNRLERAVRKARRAQRPRLAAREEQLQVRV